VKATAAQVRAALTRPGPDHRLVLLHGPDAAAAAQPYLSLVASALGAGAERVDLEGAALRADPARLAEEAASLSLFGDARWIRATGLGDDAADAVAVLLDAPVAGNPVVAVAPGIKATGRLAKLVLGHARALALACYPPSAAELEGRVADMGRERGLRVAPALARRLVAVSGGDAMVLAGEMDKFTLYLDASADRPAELTAEAVDDLSAERGEAESGRLVAAVVGGDARVLADELAHARADGTSPVAWLRQLQRRLLTLAAMRAEADAGEPVGAVIKRHRVFFREEAATAAALQHWTGPRLAAALERVRAAERAVTAPDNAGPVLAEAAATALARAQGRRR